VTDTELFFQRTDRLASILRLSQRDLAEKIGVSAGSYFGYRTGRNRITNKAWAKLEVAERAAGIISETSISDPARFENEVRSSDPNQIPVQPNENFPPDPPRIMETPPPYQSRGPQWESAMLAQLAEKDRQIERLLGIIERQASSLEGLMIQPTETDETIQGTDIERQVAQRTV
jgi:transcriptional regulator with XRE-family HTH domain